MVLQWPCMQKRPPAALHLHMACVGSPPGAGLSMAACTPAPAAMSGGPHCASYLLCHSSGFDCSGSLLPLSTWECRVFGLSFA